MTGIVKILSLLPILYSEFEEVKLITQLNNFFNFDYNVYLLDASADRDRYINGDATPKSVFVLPVDGNITGSENLNKTMSKNIFTIVVVVGGENWNILFSLIAVKNQLKTMKIGMFFMQLPPMELLKAFFMWCKNLLFVNIFVVTNIEGPRDVQLLNIFTFNPFGPLHVINVTGGSETYERFFPSLKSNFQGHSLEILNAPYTEASDSFLWHEVLIRMNATFELVANYLPNSKNLLKDYGVDILPQQYLLQTVEETLVYPSRIDSAVMIVPEALPYSEFTAYLQTITSERFFGYSLFTIAALILLLCVIRYFEQKKILFLQSVADVFNLLANDNGCVKYQLLTRAEVFLIVPLTFMGFVFVNGILSNLQSYLTKPVLQPQINTADDLYRSSVYILTTSETSKARLIDILTDVVPHQNWNNRISVSERHAIMEQIQLFNTSISTHIDLSEAKVILEVQKRLNIRGYRITEIRISFSLGTYYVNKKFLFFERLNEIIQRMISAGLVDVWRRREEATFVRNFVKQNIKNMRNNRENDAKSDEIPLRFIVYGWIAGVIVFTIEIIWKNFNLKSASKSQQAKPEKPEKQVKAHYMRKKRSNIDDIIAPDVVSVPDFDDSDNRISNRSQSNLNSNVNSSSKRSDSSASDNPIANTSNTISIDNAIPKTADLNIFFPQGQEADLSEQLNSSKRSSSSWRSNLNQNFARYLKNEAEEELTIQQKEVVIKSPETEEKSTDL